MSKKSPGYNRRVTEKNQRNGKQAVDEEVVEQTPQMDIKPGNIYIHFWRKYPGKVTKKHESMIS